MDAYTIEKKDMKILLKRFQEGHKVFGPIKPGLESKFDEIKSIEQLHLDYISTVLPPKKFFHPPKEAMFSYKIENGRFTSKEIPVTYMLYSNWINFFQEISRTHIIKTEEKIAL